MRGAGSFVFSLVIGLALTGCQPNAAIRNIAQACVAVDADAANCAAFSLEQDPVPDPKHDHPDQSFLLGFVEFDDQGKPYNRDQITTSFDRIEMEAQYRDLCIIVFVHGWKHIDGVVHSDTAAFSRSLAPRRSMADQNKDREIAGYGDLVVLVNPAIEAMRYQSLSELLDRRRTASFAPNQNPVFVEVTSTADWATGIAFPFGRLLNTTFESFTSEGEHHEAMTALGHIPGFWTHDLKGPTPEADPNATPTFDVRQECADFNAFNAGQRPNGYLIPGWQRRYRAGAVLTHRASSEYDPNDPFWIILTDQSMIRSHSDIEEPVFIDFVRQVYDDLVRLKEAEPCEAAPKTAFIPRQF